MRRDRLGPAVQCLQVSLLQALFLLTWHGAAPHFLNTYIYIGMRIYIYVYVCVYVYIYICVICLLVACVMCVLIALCLQLVCSAISDNARHCGEA